jgi:hypothetical protein
MNRMRVSLLTRSVSGLLLPGAFLACGGDETPAGTEDHTPVRYTVLVNGAETQPPFTFTAAQAVTVQLKFFNAEDEDLDIVEDEHFGRLAFTPQTLAFSARDPDHHYRFTVTGNITGTGTLQVSYGHDELADETSFDPVPVTVAD